MIKLMKSAYGQRVDINEVHADRRRKSRCCGGNIRTMKKIQTAQLPPRFMNMAILVVLIVGIRSEAE